MLTVLAIAGAVLMVFTLGLLGGAAEAALKKQTKLRKDRAKAALICALTGVACFAFVIFTAGHGGH